MKITKYIAFVLLTCLATQAIAQNEQDPWLKRNWNNMVARFNIYFNATQKLEAGVATLASKQVDDFNNVIDVYPYGTEEDAKSLRSAMETAMKKASKVIQNKPRSKWADDAYFIIGQTQFFSGDYYAAIETFQFVNSSFTDENMKAMSQLWLMKSYIQQEKLDDAEAIFGLLEKIKSPNPEFTSQLNLSAGDLMVKQSKNGEAIKLLSKGLNKLKDRTLKYRTHFVLGQLYLESKKYNKANTHFVKVLRMNAPYEYVFHANLGMAKSSAESGGKGSQKTIKYLKRMLNDDKNLDYYDQIYFELAKLEFGQGNQKEGLDYMRQSAKGASNNYTQKTKTYLFLADYYFTERNYSLAQAYYDSTVSVIPEKYPDSDKIKAKHSVLSKLIENVETIKTQDSLLLLSELDREVLDKRIDRYIEEEAEQARLAKEAEELEREQNRMNNLGGGSGPIGQPRSGNNWYFYDVAAVGRGENDFKRLWGNRKLTDNWRFVNKSLMEDELTDPENEENDDDPDVDNYISSNDKDQNEAIKDVEAEKMKYYADIPFSATAKLVANKKIQLAYLGIGKIYFDDLREYSISKDNFTKLINKYPNSIHKPEALFYLSKASSELGDEDGSKSYAQQIAKDFPETAYNKVLNGKEIEEDNSDEEVIKIYESMYTAFQQGEYSKVVGIKKQIDENYAGNSIQGKIDFLYALTIGKTKGKEAYLEELEIVKEAYSGTEIGERAAYTIRLLTDGQKIESNVYDNNSKGLFYYVITGKTSKGNEVEIQLGNYNEQFFGSMSLATKSIVFGDKQMFYVKQFMNEKEAIKYHSEMKSSVDFLKNSGLTDYNYYAISDVNFKTLVKTQKEKEYLQFFNQKYK